MHYIENSNEKLCFEQKNCSHFFVLELYKQNKLFNKSNAYQSYISLYLDETLILVVLASIPDTDHWHAF